MLESISEAETELVLLSHEFGFFEVLLQRRGSEMRKFTFWLFFMKINLFAPPRFFCVKNRKNERNESNLFVRRGEST